MRYYDPPSGWRYGFPKPYKPLPEETFEQTLRRDGYPDKLMSLARATIFWEKDEAKESQQKSKTKKPGRNKRNVSDGSPGNS